MDAILSGLAAAHRAGIVHRDVKPENVLLAEDGRIKIGDFGLARATTANTASGAQLMGTIAYLAPELVTRGTADARSDIYSLGIMLYEMLTGEQPYKGEQPMQIAYQHATDSVPRPSAKNTAVPEQLDELVLWSTERSPDDRPVDAGEMLSRLRDVEKELGLAPQVARAVAVGTAAAPTTPAESRELTKVLPQTAALPAAAVDDHDNATRLRARTRRRTSRGAWMVVLVLLLAAAAAGTGWWFGSGPGSLVAVPDVAQRSYADAEQLLALEQLQAQSQDVTDFDIPAGRTVGSDPAAGQRIDKDSVVTVFVSIGPATHQIEGLGGRSADEARALLGDARVDVGEDASEFTDAAAGSVLGVTITPRSGAEAFACTDGCTVYEGDSASMLVSLGPIPEVVGLTQGQAERALSDAGLDSTATEEYSNSVASGDVISYDARPGGGNWRPGDSVTLRVSIGPRPVQIPEDVVGKSIRDAVAQLQGLGFEVNAGIEDGTLPLGFRYWDIYKVRATNPKAGSTAPQGATITLTPTL